MKKFFSKALCFILIFTILVTSTPVFANETSANETLETKYRVVAVNETSYGTVFYVKKNNIVQPCSFWDLVDVLMAGKSWADLFSEPSWANFGWAVLDTAAILPLLPSTAYFRQGGKVVMLKVDEVAKFAKTSKGKRAISSAMKTFKYSDGITSKAIKEIRKAFKEKEAEKVIKIFKDAANKGLVGPEGEAGIKKLRSAINKYTHKIEIKNSQYGDYKIFGYKTNSGEWIFDLFKRGKH